jgi:hypothetical protein
VTPSLMEIGSMTDLSPAAQAVLDAAYALPLKNGQPHLAAALRAAADQVAPAKLESYGIRYELLRIAAELEGQ